MVITIEEIKRNLISHINWASNTELIKLYSTIHGVKIENVGDDYFPCYVEEEKSKLYNNIDKK